jgi:putative oxidoreductase
MSMVGKVTQKWGAWLTESRGYALSSVGLLILRVALGVFMAGLHGWGKLGMLTDGAVAFADPIGIGVGASLVLATFAEFACSILLVLGLFTRLACVPLIVTMAVAAFIVHGGDPWGEKELAYIYLAGYLTLLLTGPGKFSVDALIMKR